MALAAERALFSSNEQRLAILKAGLPSPANYSDHIPIGAVLRWENFPDGEVPNLQVEARNDGGSRKEQKTTEDPALEALQLLEACPITEEQRQEFELVTAPVPGTEVRRGILDVLGVAILVIVFANFLVSRNSLKSRHQFPTDLQQRTDHYCCIF